MTSTICQFHDGMRADGMRACARLDDRVCSGRFVVEHVLSQECVLAPFLFNIFLAALINVAHTRFKAEKDIMNDLMHLRNKNKWGGSNCRKVSPGDAALRRAFTLTLPRSSENT